jgi:hypothetical protein
VPRPRLSDEVPPPLYVIDTCSLRQLGRWQPPPSLERMWTGMISLVEQELVKTSEFVWRELRSGAPQIAERLVNYHDLLVEPISVEIGLQAGLINQQFPKMCHPTSATERADPWIIAIAKVHGAMVVTEEDGKKRPEAKIPFACSKLGVKVISLRELLENEPSVFAESA